MTWLNFVTLNGVAPIKDLHLVSDAGAGEGLMQYHPTRDTELIVCGRANNALSGAYLPSPVLENGSVTPAILVHGVLRALQKRGFKIRLHCYQLGLDNLPDFSGCKLDDVVIHQCEVGKEKALIEAQLIPELKRQASSSEKHLIAESGIGGTTFATVWLKRWLGKEIMFSGSTRDPDKLSRKEQVIKQLLMMSDALQTDVGHFSQDLHLSDPIQRATCALLTAELKELILAGGTMMFAPAIAMDSEIRIENLKIATTRWIFDSPDAAYAASKLPQQCSVLTPNVNFNHSRFSALNKYEQGYVVEGCGLGASLVFAEEQGMSGKEIIDCLDDAVSPWLE
ncbi:hypothetical protein [Photobacterium sp. OFAV2-7]|uniref:hypothetical protein n=1 Tax=Photobacterium sp. OFAV2-7 TaxID=2917748 RepID=UPI001EF4D919|nr:hypothetical protein [Photobacterium sp. OFAV2-7]MCG7586451.1 hypothetical protein [Photobacterium sp. OFAV2-7]